jgi:hypothetical protein
MIVANTRETWFRRSIKSCIKRNPMNIVCGDGRLEALVALGEKTIPAVIVETTRRNGAACAHGELA